jgi:plastocyanin
MRRPTTASGGGAPLASVLLACSALVAAAGCGSSNSSAGHSPSTATIPTGAGTISTPAAQLKVTSKPKYGTPPSSSPVLSGNVQVAYRNIAIQPDVLRVKAGSTITWSNYDSIEHNVTSEGGPQTFASKDFGEGGKYQIVAAKPGVIHYECTIHPASMNGTIDVVN